MHCARPRLCPSPRPRRVWPRRARLGGLLCACPARVRVFVRPRAPCGSRRGVLGLGGWCRKGARPPRQALRASAPCPPWSRGRPKPRRARASAKSPQSLRASASSPPGSRGRPKPRRAHASRKQPWGWLGAASRVPRPSGQRVQSQCPVCRVHRCSLAVLGVQNSSLSVKI